MHLQRAAGELLHQSDLALHDTQQRTVHLVAQREAQRHLLEVVDGALGQGLAIGNQPQ